jgi:transposase InsO family protein
MGWLDKLKWSLRMVLKTLKEVSKDVWNYYFTPYPILLVIGAFRRLFGRLKLIWVPRGRGRPTISPEVVDLVLEMKRDNPGWGALRISQELALLGVVVSDEAVRNILRINGFVPPRMRFTPTSWEAFFAHHKHIWQVDFTCIFDSLGEQIFIFAAIDFESRIITTINATLHPTREWIIQQFRNATIEGFELPTALIADNDGVYGKWLDVDLKRYFDIEVFRTPYRQPWKNGRIERLFKSIKDEIFHRINVVDCDHVLELCYAWREYYNRFRPHQAKAGTKLCDNSSIQTVTYDVKLASVRKITVTDGLITRYELAA